MIKNETLAILKLARKLISKGFIKGSYQGRNTDGTPAFCALGAMREASTKITGQQFPPLTARDLLEQSIRPELRKKYGHIPGYNDAPHRTQAQMVALFDRAIARARKIK